MMTKKLLFVALLALIVSPSLVGAESTFTTPPAFACLDLPFNASFGERSAAVSSLQAYLAGRGYFTYSVTGYFGPITLVAVKNFQRDQRIIQTGFVGPLTRARIKLLTCVPSNPNSPVIDGVGGPTTLDINERGTWTIQAHDPQNGSLSYSIIWGDESAATPATYGQALAERAFVQTATFEHTYARAGTFQPTFFVRDDQGNQTQTSLTVRVGDVSQPTVRVVTPNGGERWVVGNQYLLHWRLTNAPVGSHLQLTLVDGPTPIEIKGYSSPVGGDKELSFTVPTNGCITDYCYKFNPGQYKVRIVLYDRAPCLALCAPGSPSNEAKIIAEDISDRPFTILPNTSACYVGGCSGEVCSDSPGVAGGCVFRPEYACYRTISTKCERQTNGQCGWTSTNELQACLANPPQP